MPVAIIQSAGMMTATYAAASQNGAARPRTRRCRRVAPRGRLVSRNVHVQSTLAPSLRQRWGTWVVECRTSTWGACTASTTYRAVPGGPSGTVSPATSSRVSLGSSTSELGRFAGKNTTSTQRGVYQPPRCHPICVSHGQTASGCEAIVMAWLVTAFGCITTLSPGNSVRRSARVEPAVRPRTCRAAQLAIASPAAYRSERPIVMACRPCHVGRPSARVQRAARRCSRRRLVAT